MDNEELFDILKEMIKVNSMWLDRLRKANKELVEKDKKIEELEKTIIELKAKIL